MEDECQKYKRLSYTAELKCEVVQCAEENGNCETAAIFGVDESNVQLWWKHKAAISECEAS
jgi:transposase-like protein